MYKSKSQAFKDFDGKRVVMQLSPRNMVEDTLARLAKVRDWESYKVEDNGSVLTYVDSHGDTQQSRLPADSDYTVEVPENMRGPRLCRVRSADLWFQSGESASYREKSSFYLVNGIMHAFDFYGTEYSYTLAD